MKRALGDGLARIRRAEALHELESAMADLAALYDTTASEARQQPHVVIRKAVNELNQRRALMGD